MCKYRLLLFCLLMHVGNQFGAAVISDVSASDINKLNENGHTDLMVAAYNGNYEVVDLLIKKGADVNIVDNNGYSALFKAVGKGKYKIVQLLLKAGALPHNDQLDTDIISYVIHLSNCTNIYELQAVTLIFNLLIEMGIGVDIRNSNWQTPLMVATRAGKKNFIELLLNAGADPHIKNKDGKSAVDISIEIRNNDIYSLLTRREAMLQSRQSRISEAIDKLQKIPLDLIRLIDEYLPKNIYIPIKTNKNKCPVS